MNKLVCYSFPISAVSNVIRNLIHLPPGPPPLPTTTTEVVLGIVPVYNVVEGTNVPIVPPVVPLIELLMVFWIPVVTAAIVEIVLIS